MLTPKQKLSWKEGYGRAAGVVFFVLFYLYVWLRVDTSLIYYANRGTLSFPVFLRGAAFFKPFLAYPGGLVEYAAAFLSQLYYYPWLGAAIVTLATAVMCLCARALLASLAGRRVPIVHLVPAVLVLMIYNRYGLFMHTFLGLLTGLVAAAAYVRWAPRRAVPRLIVFLLMSAPVYYASAGGYLLFALLCCVWEALKMHRLVPGAVCLLSALAIPYLAGRHGFNVRISDAYARFLPFHLDADPTVSVHALCLYLFFPVSALACGLFGMLRRRRSPAEIPAAQQTQRPAKGYAARAMASKPAWIVGSLVLLLLAAALVWQTLDRGSRGVLRIEYCNQHEMWPQVLVAAGNLPMEYYTRRISWTVNRALFHTGQLLHNMFYYPVGPGDLVSAADVEKTELSWHSYLTLSDVLTDLGCVNEAERYSYEALEFLGDRPHILGRLALINTVKGQPRAAGIFLKVLGNDVVHGKAARSALLRLRQDPLSIGDVQVRRLRSLMPVENRIGNPGLEQLLVRQLQRNPLNRMAFEYLMAHYLLTGQIEKIAAQTDAFDIYAYGQLPRLCQEALVLHAAATGKQAEIDQRLIGPDTMARYREFAQILARYGADMDGAMTAAAQAGYGGGYFGYYTFVCIPRETQE